MATFIPIRVPIDPSVEACGRDAKEPSSLGSRIDPDAQPDSCHSVTRSTSHITLTSGRDPGVRLARSPDSRIPRVHEALPFAAITLLYRSIGAGSMQSRAEWTQLAVIGGGGQLQEMGEQ